MTTLLVTGAGAPGIAGTLLCLKLSGLTSRLIGVDMNPAGSAKELLDGLYQVPRPNSPAYHETLKEICQCEKISAIIPQTTREIEALSHCIAEYEALGIKILVSSPEAIMHANDKYELLKVFEALGFPTPKHRLATTLEELVEAVYDLGYPNKKVAVKPPNSNGMRGYRTLTTERMTCERYLSEKPSGVEITLDEFMRYFEGADFPKLLVTEYLPGDEYSVDAFIGEKAEIAIPRKRDVIRSGISFKTTPLSDTQMERQTLEAGRFLGLHYVFGMQYKEDEQGEPKILECNPRIQGTMVASLSANVNLIGAGLLELLGKPVSSFPLPSYGAAFQRHWGGIIHYQGNTHVI